VGIANGTVVVDYWRANPAWPEGTPAWSEDATFSGGPELGGFKKDWWVDSKNDGDIVKAHPFRKAVQFTARNPNFANDSEWMNYFNPEWTEEGKSCASELQDYADKAPLDEEVFLDQLSSEKFELPAKWSDLTTERAREHHRFRGHDAEHIAGDEQGNLGDMECGVDEVEELVQVIRQPARGSEWPERTLNVIAADSRRVANVVAGRALAAAELRSDEPVSTGSFVFIALTQEDMVCGFTQPLALVLVTDVQFATPREADVEEEGSVNHNDTLVVQYLTATAYDKLYAPAVMVDVDAERANLPRNSIHSGTILRGQVAIANVITNANKVGTGRDATFEPTNPYPTTFSGGQVPARFKFRLDGKTTIASLKTHAAAEFAHHAGKTRRAAPPVPAGITGPQRPTRTRTRRHGDGGAADAAGGAADAAGEEAYVPESESYESGEKESSPLRVGRRRKSRRLQKSNK
jgi:hypothetical protein